MVRQNRRVRIPTKNEAYAYPSRYGSHSSMIHEDKTKELDDENLVVLEDEYGYYITERKKLDSGLSDPKRWGSDRALS